MDNELVQEIVKEYDRLMSGEEANDDCEEGINVLLEKAIECLRDN